MENDKPQIPEGKEVKEKLNEVLEKHFKTFDQINVIGDKIPLTMASVAALHLVVEKESEIEETSSPVERYSRKSFLEDLTELGLDIDDDLMTSFEALSDKEYVKIDSEGQYHAQVPATEIVSNFNKMFPGMPGMNLVAYVIQTLDEILSGRKEYAKAIEQFDQALASRGRPLTFVHLRTERKTEKQKAEERIKRAKEREESRKASLEMKKIYSEKLMHLRKSGLTEAEEPLVVTKRAIGANEISIKEISPKKLQEAKERERLEQERLERERIEQERLRLEQEKEELERLTREHEEKERLERERLEAERIEKEKLEQEEREREERRRQEEERLLKEREEQRKLEQERLEQERLERERIEKEMSIEAQIAAFESEQTEGCPVCQQGKIIQDTTESGKVYFKCSNEGCRFISWDKPYNFMCPLCRNPYLMEFRTPDGGQGLKCPKATCSYIQNSLERPTVYAPPEPEMNPGVGNAVPVAPGGDSPPKKKRLVRRKKR